MKPKMRKRMSAIVDLQLAIENSETPDREFCEQVVSEVLETLKITESKECTIRIVDEQESADLNAQYRNKDNPTNVLSFPFEAPLEMDIELLGDIVICAPVVASEAKQQNKSETMHWTHLITHGCLHLLGFDHQSETEAEEMENLERTVLSNLGYTDPYQLIDPVA